MQLFGGQLNVKNDKKLIFQSVQSVIDFQKIEIGKVDFIYCRDETNSISPVNYFSEKNFYILGEIRLYNQAELNQQLETSFVNPHQLILKAYQTYGEDFLNYVNGDFSFVIWDSEKEMLFCVRDPLGQRPFFYSFNEERFVFGSNFKIVHQNTKETKAENLDEDWIIHFLSSKYSGKTRTIFESIKRLEPGHILTLKNNHISLKKYWKIKEKFSALTPKTLDETRLQLKKEIVRSVEERIQLTTKSAVELSGGLDSSLVGAIAQERHQQNNLSIDAFTNVLAETDKSKFSDFYDEWDKANKVAQYCNIENHIPVDKAIADPIQLMDLFLSINGCPSNFHFSILQKGIYNLARERGNQNLLSGFGGDEMVSSSASGKFIFTTFKRKGTLGLYFLFRSQGNSVLNSVLKSAKFLRSILLRKEARQKEEMYQTFLRINLLNEKFTKKYKTEFKNKTYFPENQTLKEREDFHLNSGAFVERLETGYQITNETGLTYSLPLLDVRLLEYFYHIPEEIKGNHKMSRFLFREICKDYLPKEIAFQSKPSNAMTMPFNKIEMINQMKTLVDYSLSIPESNVLFNYVDRGKLIQLTENINFEKGENKKYKMLLRIIMLSRFFDQHIDQVKF